MSKKAFVTGGTGFVGSHLAESLLSCGYTEVRCLVRTRQKWLKGINIVPVRGTLRDHEMIQQAVKDVNFVYHLGGITRARTYEALQRGNVTDTLHLLDAISTANPGIRKVLITSTLAVVGPAPGGRADETTPLNPVSRYGRSKTEMEAALQDRAETLPLVIVRPPSVYGPRDKDIYTFFKAVARGVCPILRHDPGMTLVHASDLVRGMIAAAESDATRGKTYFIGNDATVSWEALKKVTMDALGARALTLPVPRSLVLPLATVVEGLGTLMGRYPPLNREKGQELLRAAKICSSARAKEDFGYEPQVPLAQGVADTIAWYQTQGLLRTKR